MTDNLAIWNVLSRTDPKHTKAFKRAGGFSGTALKPIWIVKRLTEQFGPVGIGWGFDEPSFQVVQGNNGEVLVYCTVRCWHTEPVNHFYGVGGDKVVTYIKANEQYKRPERWENDDEAFKKAFTDAVNNAFKFVGVGADVHMGQFDDNKYVAAMQREFSGAGGGAGQSLDAQVSPPAADKLTEAVKEPHKTQLKGPYKTKTALWKAVREFDRELRGCGDSDELDAFVNMKESQELLKQCDEEVPALSITGEGMPDEFVPLRTLIARMKSEFDAVASGLVAPNGQTIINA